MYEKLENYDATLLLFDCCCCCRLLDLSHFSPSSIHMPYSFFTNQQHWIKALTSWFTYTPVDGVVVVVVVAAVYCFRFNFNFNFVFIFDVHRSGLKLELCFLVFVASREGDDKTESRFDTKTSCVSVHTCTRTVGFVSRL